MKDKNIKLENVNIEDVKEQTLERKSNYSGYGADCGGNCHGCGRCSGSCHGCGKNRED